MCFESLIGGYMKQQMAFIIISYFTFLATSRIVKKVSNSCYNIDSSRVSNDDRTVQIHPYVIDIDPTAIPGPGKGDHDFCYNSPWVSSDALLGINLDASPAERGLASKKR